MSSKKNTKSEQLQLLQDNVLQSLRQLEAFMQIVREQNETGIERFDREGITPEFLMLLGARFEALHHQKELNDYRLSQLEQAVEQIANWLYLYPPHKH